MSLILRTPSIGKFFALSNILLNSVLPNLINISLASLYSPKSTYLHLPLPNHLASSFLNDKPAWSLSVHKIISFLSTKYSQQLSKYSNL